MPPKLNRRIATAPRGSANSDKAVPPPPKSAAIISNFGLGNEHRLAPFGSIAQFRNAERMAAMLAHSTLVPERFKGDEHVGDCVIALDLANRVGVPVLSIMLNLRSIEGRPSWSAQFLISCVNASRRFTPLRYRMTGRCGKDDRGCVACAKDRTGDILESPEVTIRMAKAEGWFDQTGSKWRTMPDLMLRYRSATLFARLYAPELALGIQTSEELVDIGAPSNGYSSRPVFEANAPQIRPGCKPRSSANLSTAKASAANTSGKPGLALSAGSQRQGPGHRLKHAQTTSRMANSAELRLEPASALAEPGRMDTPFNHLKALRGLIRLSKRSEAAVLMSLQQSGRCGLAFTTLNEAAEKQPGAIVWAYDNWNLVEQGLGKAQPGEVK